MTQAELIVNFVNWGINVAFIVSLVFPIAIRPIWAWTKHSWGWNIVVLDWAISLALLPVWVHRAFNLNPDTYLFGWIQAASIWIVPVIILWRAVIIWLTQRYKTNGNSEREP